MLDQQFDENPDYYEYVNKNFIPVSMNPTYMEGDRLFRYYNVKTVPTVLMIRHDGAEYTRFENYSSPEKFLREIKKALREIRKLNKSH